MLGAYSGEGPEPIGFYITPKFSLLFFLSIYDPLRVANEISGKKLFSYKIISESGGLVTAANGMTVLSNASISEVDFMPTVVVCSGYEPERYQTKPALSWLRRLARRGAQFGAIDTGCYLLAAAGLLNGYRVSVHWQAIESFREQFPDIRVTDEQFEINRDRFTCAGGAAGFEMMLRMIGHKHGSDLAAAIAEQFIYDRFQNRVPDQQFPHPLRLGVHNPTVIKAIELMERQIEEPLEVDEIAALVGISRRQLERLFGIHLGETPTGHYLKIRLRRARDLLQYTSMSVMDVAIACGFASLAHFSRAYKRRFSRSPRNDRKMVAYRTSE